MKLLEKVALITGAASGMGKAEALLFAEEGAKIIAVDVNAEGVKKTVEEIVSKGGDAIAIAPGLIETPMTLPTIRGEKGAEAGKACMDHERFGALFCYLFAQENGIMRDVSHRAFGGA